MTTGERIKSLRVSKGMSQEELGAIVGVQRAAINKYENGLVVNLKRSIIAKLADALDSTPAYLMGWEDEEGTTDLGLSALDIANWAGVSVSCAEAAIKTVNPSSITTDALDKIFSEIMKTEPEIRAIQRAAKNMTQGDKQRMLAMLQLAFREAFEDDNGGKS